MIIEYGSASGVAGEVHVGSSVPSLYTPVYQPDAIIVLLFTPIKPPTHRHAVMMHFLLTLPPR